MIRFDDIDDWFPKLAEALAPHVSPSLLERVRASGDDPDEAPQRILLGGPEREQIIDATLGWIRQQDIAGYHGTRLTDAEVKDVLKNGLVPLQAAQRTARLTRALRVHPRWLEVSGTLSNVLEAHSGLNGAAGSRENQVHLTLSRAGLTDGFNHYLLHGAEFDKHVAYAMLGDEGVSLLAHDGTARVIEFSVPGDDALRAAHPIFSIDDVRRSGEVPNIVNEFLDSWSIRQADAEFQCSALQVDCGMVFRGTVLPRWIERIDTLTD